MTLYIALLMLYIQCMYASWAISLSQCSNVTDSTAHSD